jgi:ectoine hydroxylase-related dioxygenase (phytanoyl-CoA dioxygenase family)
MININVKDDQKRRDVCSHSSADMTTQRGYALLTDNQKRSYEMNGFACLDRITSREEVLKIRSILEDLFRKKAGEKEGDLFDTLATNGGVTGQKSLQITNPMNYSADLRNLEFVRIATGLAKQILGDGAKLTGDFVILKPAKQGLGTPWHQDEAYRDPRFNYRELTIWMSLQDVAQDSGCMSFIPGSHRTGIYSHRSAGNDAHVHALECSEDLSKMSVVSCPLPTGGCTLHHGRTLHCTNTNRSLVPRYAYILVFHIPPTPAHVHRSFPWLEEKKSAERARKRAWLLRGGAFVIAWRKFRRGDLWDIAGIRYGIKRGISALRKR